MQNGLYHLKTKAQQGWSKGFDKVIQDSRVQKSLPDLPTTETHKIQNTDAYFCNGSYKTIFKSKRGFHIFCLQSLMKELL